MAKDKDETSKEIDDLQNSLFASNFGLSRNFLTKNQEEIFKSNKAVSDVLLGFGVNTGKSNLNSIRELSRIVGETIRFDNGSRQEFPTADDPSGIRTITPMGNLDNNEQQIIDISAKKYQSFLNTTQEYRGVVNIIPQVKRSINNIVRDILNKSEVTGKAFNQVYDDDVIDNEFALNDSNKQNIARCSEKIKEEIIEKNKLEDKFKRWIFESCVCGVKPVAFIPYSHIINELKKLDKSTGIKVDINKANSKLRSGESLTQAFESKDDVRKFNEFAIESSFEDMCLTDKPSASVESTQLRADVEFDDILTDDLVEDYARSYESDFAKGYDKFQMYKSQIAMSMKTDSPIIGTESGGVLPNEELIDKISKKADDNKTKLSEIGKDKNRRKEEARKGLKILAHWIDENIDVVKPQYASTFQVNKINRQKDRYSNFYDLGKDYKMAEGIKTTQAYSTTSKTMDGNDSSSVFDNATSLGKECLIAPYAPESVIPINVNGEYLGFYAIEYDNLVGPSFGKKRRSGSFTDYVSQQGMGDDSSFLGGVGSPAMAYGGADPLENNLYSPLSLYNYSAAQYMFGGTDQEDQKFDILKTVVLRVLSHRLRDPDLVDNKLFKDAVMTMLRNDVITRKRVQFTFIPPEFMCYMTYKIDDDGVPISILDGTLMFCYMYISSLMSSAMIKLLKSADKEKYEIDVGLQKNANYSITELQRVFSTRTLYSDGMFGSLQSVIKNAGNYQRMIIPVIKDKKLYDVTQMERTNNLDPDDSYTEKLLQGILSAIYINSGSMSEMDSVDFAKQLSMRNLEYRNNIVDAQNNYFPNFITKAVRILVSNSGLETYNSKSEIYNGKSSKTTELNKIDISKINVRPSPPTYLSMTNVTEVVNSAKDVASALAEALDLQGGNETENKVLSNFKLNIIKKYTQIVDWDEIEEVLKQSRNQSAASVVEKVKSNAIDEKLNTPIDEINDTNPSKISGNDSMGGGGMDMGGGSSDMGGMDDLGGGGDDGLEDMGF